MDNIKNTKEAIKQLEKLEKRGKKIAKKTINDYKAFAIKGNVIDLAIGVIIGSAFTSIVNALVNNIITPFLGLLTNRVDLSTLFVSITGGTYNSIEEAKQAGEIVINYGSLLNSVINFFFISITLFIVFKYISKLRSNLEKEQTEETLETTKTCPYCFSTININSTRCAHCTSKLTTKATDTIMNK